MDCTPQSTGVLEPGPPRLLDHVRERTRLRHYSIRTEQAYVGWGGSDASFSPTTGAIRGNSVPEVEAFLTRLAMQGNVAAATLPAMRPARWRPAVPGWPYGGPPWLRGRWGDGGRCPDWMALPHAGATYRSTCAPRRCFTVGWMSLLSFTTWSSDSPSRPCGVLRCLVEVHA